MIKLDIKFINFIQFIEFIKEIQPYLNIDKFIDELQSVYKFEFIGSTSNFKRKIIKLLNLQGKTITQEIYWSSRGWEHPKEKVTEIQKSWSKISNKQNSHKGKCSLQWFIDKHGEVEGIKLHNDFHKKRSIKNTYDYILKTKGNDALEKKKKEKSTMLKLEGFITRYGVEQGTKKFEAFCDKSKITLEKFILKYGTEEGNIKYKQYQDKLALKATQRFVLDGTFTPNKGNNETKILDKIEQSENIIIDRNFKIWRYHPDGYCHETNTIYEVYEQYHKLKKQQTKDEKRIKWITNRLNCKVVIIWDLPL